MGVPRVASHWGYPAHNRDNKEMCVRIPFLHAYEGVSTCEWVAWGSPSGNRDNRDTVDLY